MDYFEHIENYLEGRLSEEDKQLFDDELKRNEELRIALGNHQEVSGALDLLVEEGVREVLRKDKAKEIQLNPKNTNSWRWIGIAASLLLLAGAMYFLNPFSSPSHDDLYVAYFSDFLPPTTRGDDYVDELRVCDKAHYLMTEGDVINAETILKQHLSEQEDGCTDKSQWYMMLIHLKKGDNLKTNNLLDQIINDSGSIYRERAQELKDKLN